MAARTKTNKAAVTIRTYPVEKLVKSKSLREYKNLLLAVLDKGKLYSIDEAKKILNETLKRKVR